VKLPSDCRQCRDAKSIEPIGLVKMGLEVKPEGRACLRPEAVVVAGEDPERVSPWSYVCVVGNAPACGVHPIPVKAFQFVFEPDLLRSWKAQPGVLEGNACLTRRQNDVSAGIYSLAIHQNLLDSHGWRRLV